MNNDWAKLVAIVAIWASLAGCAYLNVADLWFFGCLALAATIAIIRS